MLTLRSKVWQGPEFTYYKVCLILTSIEQAFGIGFYMFMFAGSKSISHQELPYLSHCCNLLPKKEEKFSISLFLNVLKIIEDRCVENN